ncbi:hypothetical protein A2U01_0078705, partial [Trifolium medium]|nr:hypothetical protein [Trifolium medium]
VQECNANIAKWEEEIADFQAQVADRERKISGEKEKRTKIEEAVASSTQEAIDEAAKDGIKYYNASKAINEEIKALNDSINILDIEIALLKDH